MFSGGSIDGTNSRPAIPASVYSPSSFLPERLTVCKSDESDNRSRNDSQDVVVNKDGSNKDVDYCRSALHQGSLEEEYPLRTDSTAQEREHERGVSRNVRRDLELEKNGCWKGKKGQNLSQAARINTKLPYPGQKG